MSYSVREYAAMIADRARVEAHLAALAGCIRPGTTMCDLGTGTGFFAVAACRLGAGRVYAIETNDCIEVARAFVRDNGCADRVELIHVSSLETTLPERVDVLFHDLRGMLPAQGGSLRSIADARRRFLAPGGTQIGQRDVLFGAVAEVPEMWADHATPWRRIELEPRMGAIQDALIQSLWRLRVPDEAFVTAPSMIATIDYTTNDSAHLSTQLRTVASRAGVGHGVQVWFDAILAEGIRYSTRGAGAATVYGASFFPWLGPVTLEAGDTIEVDIDARLVGDAYVWRWRTRVTSAGHDAPRATFDQSTFFGEPISADSLLRRAPGHRTHLGERGQVDQLVLERMAVGAKVAEIASELSRRWPSRFAGSDDAIAHVGALSDLYGR